MTKGKKIMSFPLIAVAVLFLFNPNITVIDLLPDFIGYILLCAALSRLADVHERIGEAYTAFKRMIFIDCGKWLAVIWIFGLSVPSERNTSLLLGSFVFAVIEMICLLPAYNKLFDGLTQLGYLYPNVSVFGERGRRSYTDKIKILTFIFVSAKAILSFLPELADLTNSTYDENMGGVMNLYQFIGLLRVMAFIPTLIIGIVWLFRVIAYFKRLSKDTGFIDALNEKYDKDVRPKTGLFVRRNFATFTLIAGIALVLTADIRIDSNNILPDFFAAVLFIIAFVFIGKYNGQKKNWLFSTVVFTCFSIISSVGEYMFFAQYYYGAIIKSDEVRNFYILVVVLNILKSGCLVWVFCDLYKALLKVVKKHTGYVVGMERDGDKESKMIASVHADLKNELNRALVFAILYVVSDICFDIFAPKVDLMGLINIVFAIACVGFFLKAFSEIRHAMDTKYMLE